MNVVLFRNGSRALILGAGRSLIDCQPAVRYWLGTPYTEDHTELTADTPMPGIHPPTVLAELLQRGFCALDIHGVVTHFKPVVQSSSSRHIATKSLPETPEPAERSRA